MKQQSLFKTYWKLYTDGASRNNPGPAGIGIYLLKNGECKEKQGFFIGSKTNNQAEYLALLVGLYYLSLYVQPGESVSIISDSQLLIRQLQGIYRVKNQGLQPLYHAAKQWLQAYSHTLEHVMREQNVMADSLANLGIEKKIDPPEKFIDALHKHGISL